MIELHYRVRQQQLTSRQTALSIGLGTLIGCQPLYGLHLVLCLAGARLLSLSGSLAYLASCINNPWSAPLLLYLEAGLGHWLFSGEWISLDLEALRAAGLAGIGRDLFAGAALAGVLLGALAAAVTLAIHRRWRFSPTVANLADGAAGRYRRHGIRSWEYVRGKLRHDPVYVGLLRSGWLPASGRLVDVGCGRGILFAAVSAARQLALDGRWPPAWPEPPANLELTGIEVDFKAAAAARLALGQEASIETIDARAASLPPCDAIALIDSLHYLGAGDQESLIARAAAALRPGGVLLIREADAGGGLRFAVTRGLERLSAWTRGDWRRRFLYRTDEDWRRLVEQQGLAPSSSPMARGTPFSNVLIAARKPALA